jgi:hypothetical protein
LKYGEEPDIRVTLPVQRNPQQKVGLWTIIKDMIGKDITKISVPGI